MLCLCSIACNSLVNIFLVHIPSGMILCLLFISLFKAENDKLTTWPFKHSAKGFRHTQLCAVNSTV